MHGCGAGGRGGAAVLLFSREGALRYAGAADLGLAPGELAARLAAAWALRPGAPWRVCRTEGVRCWTRWLGLPGRELLAIARREPPGPTPPFLSGRQDEVLELIGAGLAEPDVSARLGIARSTVRAHLQRVYRTVGIRRREELQAWLAAGRPIPEEGPASERCRACPRPGLAAADAPGLAAVGALA